MLKHKNKFISFLMRLNYAVAMDEEKKMFSGKKNLEIGNFEIEKKWNEEKEKKKNVNWKFQQ